MKTPGKEIPDVIPPGTVVRLTRVGRNTPDWKIDVGRRFRIGYYRPKDGLDCVWLVNEMGEYEQTTDRKTLLGYFEIDRLSDETDYFGESRRPLRAMTPSGRRKPDRKIKAPPLAKLRRALQRPPAH
jgi:hypothetical protein